MQKYIGVKLVMAMAMSRQEYNDYRGWKLRDDENGDDIGQLIEYVDGGKPNDERHSGYISWSPNEVFEKSYRKTSGLTFGLAVEAAKMGKKVGRSGWNGSGMFAYIVPARAEETSGYGCLDKPYIYYREYWVIKTAQDDIATWAPSGSDSLADDWMILE